MPYARRRGNQVAIVHGARDPATKKVEQRILFTLYSRAEAREALGQGAPGNGERFQRLLEGTHPTLRFDWDVLRRDIEALLPGLPETYEDAASRLRSRFREDLLTFTRQLVLADPGVVAGYRLVAAHRAELEYLKRLIDWRLEAPEEEENEYNGDNAFLWRFTTRDEDVPPDVEEDAAELYEQQDFAAAAAAFRVLTQAFPGYAEGHNYLGLIALELGRVEGAIGHFEKTVELGRRLFPRRVAKQSWWSDLSTRPYMRGLGNLALALNQAGRYEEALKACARLETECHDDITAAAHRGSVHLNMGRWQEALDAARYLHQVDPSESLPAALAAFELGREEEARGYFIHAALNAPRTVAMVLGLKLPRPKDSSEVRDHNGGVSMLRQLGAYLDKRFKAARRHFTALWEGEQVSRLRKEVAEAEARWRQHPKEPDRAAFERMTELKSWEFADQAAGRPLVAVPPLDPGGRRRKLDSRP